MAGTQRRPRQRSIRDRLAIVFVVPLVSLLALWGFAASTTLTNAIREHNDTGLDSTFGSAAVNLGVQLAEDRQAAVTWLGSGGSEGLSLKRSMVAQFRTTERAASAFVTKTKVSMGSIVTSAQPALASFERQLGNLPGLHNKIELQKISVLDAVNSYSAITNAELYYYSKLVYVSDVGLYQQSEASVQTDGGLEMALRAIALIMGSLANGGHMNTAEHVALAQSVGNQRQLLSSGLRQLSPALGSGFRRAVASPEFKSFEAIENKVMLAVSRKRPIPVNAQSFLALNAIMFHKIEAGERQDGRALSNLGTRTGDRLLLELVLAGGLGLVAVVLSIVLMARFARRTGRELRGLQGAALELANERLPDVVDRLSQGEEVKVAEEVAPPRSARITEIGRVYEAFGTAQRIAIESAVGQARLRQGVAQVFRNLAWRSQSLLHRQLALLDAMERKATDPDALEELFRLDHLTTRMRRHAEGLIILSGAQPGRAWRDPVPILDVLRGAIAEIEDYKRVNVITDAEDAVVGAAVADLIHLLAELIENATFYSPASTEVSVTAARVANGFAVEIEDRGIGIGAAELEVINERLANPPEFDPVNSDQLGLFVVARLAARHNVKITLRQSPYGGTAAVVLLPHSIVVTPGRTFAQANGEVPGLLPPAGPVALAPSSRLDGNASGDGRVDVATGIVVEGSPLEGNVFERGTARGSPADALAAQSVPAADTPAVAEVHSAAAPAITPSGLPVRRRAGNGASAAGQPSAAASLPDGGVAGLPGSRAASLPDGASAQVPGLPRRVRQANLAPQLRADAPAPGSDVQPAEPAGGHSAEQSRALVDALQFGWRQGLSDSGQDDVWTPASRRKKAAPAEDRDDRSAPPSEPAGEGE